jgi:hypothetical protein
MPKTMTVVHFIMSTLWVFSGLRDNGRGGA